jgi:hypothetical protein
MSKTDRLAYYFKTLGPDTLVGHREIEDLLWRGCPNGGPTDTKRMIGQLVYRIRQKPQKYAFEGYTIKADNPGHSAGYRMVRVNQGSQHG